MALHGGIARHPGDFGARPGCNAAAVYSSARPSPLQFPDGCAYQPNQRQHSVSGVFSCGIADARGERRA